MPSWRDFLAPRVVLPVLAGAGALVLLTNPTILAPVGNSASPHAPIADSPRPTPTLPTSDDARPDQVFEFVSDTPTTPTAHSSLTRSASAEPPDPATLSIYELIQLPTRAEPIARWQAQRYFCPADFNRDDAIDENDTRTFIEAYATRSGPFAEFLDLNRDGLIDQADLDLMLKLADSACDPVQIAQTRSIAC